MVLWNNNLGFGFWVLLWLCMCHSYVSQVEERWSWFQRPLNMVSHILHPLRMIEYGITSTLLQDGWPIYLDTLCADPIVKNWLECLCLKFLRIEEHFFRGKLF
jgi:hypothetical protein